MGQRFSKIEACLLAPSMEGNLDEVKRIVGEFIAECKNDNDPDALKKFVDRKDPAGNAAIHGAVNWLGKCFTVIICMSSGTFVAFFSSFVSFFFG